MDQWQPLLDPLSNDRKSKVHQSSTLGELKEIFSCCCREIYRIMAMSL